jgi:tRNA (guanine-N7-)-methyltransferase
MILKENQASHSNIRSYVKRDSRLTKSQKHALDNYWDKHGIDFCPHFLDLENQFKRHAPVIMDIGVGTGDTTINHAQSHLENNYLAIEVHRPGIGQLLNRIESNHLTNIKIINHDVVNVLQEQIPDHRLSQVFIFFPDPWPKKKHHKRRLINNKLLDLIKKKITTNGRLHIATDWEDYAKHIQQLCNADPELLNLTGNYQSAPRPNWRTKTRYESRGLRLDHDVWDFCYALNNFTKK